jgi:hypothetical protein
MLRLWCKRLAVKIIVANYTFVNLYGKKVFLALLLGAILFLDISFSD